VALKLTVVISARGPVIIAIITSQKTFTQVCFCGRFGKCGLILIILSLLRSKVNCRKTPRYNFPPDLKSVSAQLEIEYAAV